MPIDEIILTTARLLGLDEAVEALESGAGARNEEVARLLTCVDFILEELAADYFPLITEETAEAPDGRLLYAALSRPPIGIIEVTAAGKRLSFSRLCDAVKLPVGGKVKVKYCFKPAGAALGGKTEWGGQLPSLRILVYGTAAEYCVAADMAEEAALWDKRYRDALQRAASDCRKGEIRARRWFL